MERKIKRENHAEKLEKRIAEFAEVVNANNPYSDFALKIGERVFHVHKYVLQINSAYFTETTFEFCTPDLQHVNPDHFLEVIRFMYTGELLVSTNNIESLLLSGNILKMCDLMCVCNRFMTDSLAIDNALLFWRLANTYNNAILAAACQLKVQTDIEQFLVDPIGKTLKYASADMIKMILDSDSLHIKHEEEAAEILITWIDEQVGAGQEIQPEEVLHYIRWSGVDVEFVKSRILQNEFIRSDAASMAFLARVLTYLENGIQFEGLRTFRRPSSGFENCLMTLGSCNGIQLTTEISRFSLSNTDTSDTNITLEEFPNCESLNSQSKACTYNGTVYVTNTGLSPYKELWSYKSATGWKKLEDMPTVQLVHCSTFVSSTLFVLGGKTDYKKPNLVLNSVHSYNIKTDKWYTGGNLVHPVWNAACVTHKNAIFVFGGNEKDMTPVDYVQVYDTRKKNCVLIEPMPEAYDALRVMLFETSVILIGPHVCFIYNFESRLWQDRPQFKTEVYAFAAVLDNSTIFIAGGAKIERDNDSVETLSSNDEIKSVSVLELIADKEKPEWKHHAKLPKPGMVNAYVSVAIPVIDKTPKENSAPVENEQ